MKRIHSIDLVRGVVMIIMALDHVRDLIHVDAITQSPTNLATTTPALFFTRWITYLCAPVFVFLAGTSAYISLQNSSSIVRTQKFLLKRGVYLLILEFLVVNLLLFFDIGYHMLLFEVIAAIGFGFIILALLIKLSWKLIAGLGIAIIFLHNLSPFIFASNTSTFKQILMSLFSPAAFPIFDRLLVIGYPPIPWLGIMLVGFASGRLFEQIQRQRLFIVIGVVSVILFAVLRIINVYGDSIPWSTQKDPTLTFLSFMNVSKYPPSLVFCLITLGIMFIMLGIGERIGGKVVQIISVYGKVPLFYFLIHFFVIHIIMVVIMLMQGFTWPQLDFASSTFGRPKGIESGLSLFYIYVLWILIVAALYFPCKWYGKYKSNHKQWWLKYL